MKQATNPFAPVPLWRKRLPGYAAMGAATVAMAVGLIVVQHARTTVAGTLLPVSEADAAAYGISAVYQLDDGSYRVEGTQKGFQSDVQAAVTIAVDMLPLPGAQGISELMYCRIFSGVFSAGYLMPSLYVTRGITFYFLLIFSLLVVVVNQVYRSQSDIVSFRLF